MQVQPDLKKGHILFSQMPYDMREHHLEAARYISMLAKQAFKEQRESQTVHKLGCSRLVLKSLLINDKNVLSLLPCGPYFFKIVLKERVKKNDYQCLIS